MSIPVRIRFKVPTSRDWQEWSQRQGPVRMALASGVGILLFLLLLTAQSSRREALLTDPRFAPPPHSPPRMRHVHTCPTDRLDETECRVLGEGTHRGNTTTFHPWVHVPLGMSVTVGWKEQYKIYTRLGMYRLIPEGISGKGVPFVVVHDSMLIALDQMTECSKHPEDKACQEDLTYTWTAESKHPDESVTLVTQFSVNRLERFEQSIPLWPGAISVAIYLTHPEDAKILRQYLKNPEKGRLYRTLHLTIQQPRYEGGRKPKHLSYPINHLRNLAVKAVTTTHHLLIDGDFSPDPGMYGLIHPNWTDQGQGPRLHPDLRGPGEERTAWVVPCVAIPLWYTGKPPGDVGKLREMFREGSAYITDPRAGHGPTGTRQFLSPLLTTMGRVGGSYEVCYESQWEPYYILPRDKAPVWDSRFRDQGGDKQEHALVLNALGWRFRVLHDAFLYHIDHPQWRWPGAKDPSLKGPERLEGKEGREKGKGEEEKEKDEEEEWSYFTGFSQEIRQVFGETAKWPRACSQPLYVATQVSVEGIGLL